MLYTHEHADHTHGIDDLRGLFIGSRRRVDVYADEPTWRVLSLRFGYCFATPPGSNYPPIANEHRIGPGKPVTIAGPGGAVTAMPLLQDHGDIALARLPVRLHGLFERPDRPAAGKRRAARRASTSGSSTHSGTGRIPAISIST